VKIAYLSNPDLKIIKPGWLGNKVIGNEFANGEELYQPSFLNVWKWKLSTNPQKAEKEKDSFSPPLKYDANLFQTLEDGIVWLGHATFLIRLNNVNFLTDPVLFDLPFIKRRSPLPCPPEKMKPVDYILLSHGHRDHLDEQSLNLIYKQNPGVRALGSLKMEKLLKKMVPDLSLQEAGWYQQYNLDENLGVQVFYMPAGHWHRRGLNDMNKILWGSFMLRFQNKLIFFAGDTSYKPSFFQEIKSLFGSPDICILPVGAYKPAFMMQGSHLNPAEAVQAFNELGGKTYIPMHYGTFDLSDEPAGEPVRLLQEYAAAGKINGYLQLPVIGERIKV